MNTLTAITVLFFQLSASTYQNLYQYEDDAVTYKKSLEFLNCKHCLSPSIKTKKKIEPKKSKKERIEKISRYITISSLGNSASQLTKVIVYFDFNKAELKVPEKEKLSGIAGYPIRITGFTDSIGDAAPNKFLAKQRAENIAKFLQSEKGVQLSSKTIIGKELCCYADTNKTPEGRAKNRRAEILFRASAGREVKKIKKRGGE